MCHDILKIDTTKSLQSQNQQKVIEKKSLKKIETIFLPLYKAVII